MINKDVNTSSTPHSNLSVACVLTGALRSRKELYFIVSSVIYLSPRECCHRTQVSVILNREPE